MLPQPLLEFWTGEQVVYARPDREVFESDRGVVLLEERDEERELGLPVTPDCGTVERVHRPLRASEGQRQVGKQRPK